MIEELYYKEYTNLTDEEVIVRYRLGEEEAVDYLLEKYKTLVKLKARALFLMDGDRDDLIQEGMIGLYHAIRDYDETKASSFLHFAGICVVRQMYSAIKASNRKKNLPLNTYVSFYTPRLDGENEIEDRHFVFNMNQYTNYYNPEVMVIDRENTNRIEQELGKRLSSFEIEVMELYVTGMKYTEIAELLHKSPKSIDNAIQRIRQKVNEIMKEVSNN